MSELSNKERVLKIAAALEELNTKVVYVGGSVVQFYASDQGAANPMTTYDVDCVVDLTTYREYHAFEEELHDKNFSNDTSEGAPICRFLPVTYYLASKFEALHSRGGSDYRGSKDFEDIVFVVNNCHDLKEEIERSNDDEVKGYLKSEFSILCQRPNFWEEIECALDDDDRVDVVAKRMNSIT